MLRSFYVALSGLKSSKDWLDITANNVSNANTTGFKKSRPIFHDIVLQNITHYNSASNSLNNITFGGGVETYMTQIVFEQGPYKRTGVDTDVAIEGDGFLILQNNEGKWFYTRDGQLKFANKTENGVQYMYLVHNSGLNVLAYDISQLQEAPTSKGCPRSLSPVKIRVEIPAKATEHISTQEGANIDPRGQAVTKTFDPTDATTFNSIYTLQAYDAQGNPHDVGIFFVKLPEVKVNDGTADYYVSIDDNGNLYYQNGSSTYQVDKASSTSSVDSNDEFITLRQNVITASGNFDLVYDKTQGKYFLKDSSGNYYELSTSDTSITPSGNQLRLDNLWQVYALKKEGDNWVDLNQSNLSDNSNYKFDIVAFKEDGSLAGVSDSNNWTPGSLATNTKLNLQDPQGVLSIQDWDLKGLTSYPVEFALGFVQDGYPPGKIQSVDIESDGTITALYSNGAVKKLYRLGLAYFNDKQILTPIGSNLYEIKATEAPLLECAGVRSQLHSGALEMSNVDVAEEMINMITAEKAYQANAKVVQTGQTILDTTITLKR